MSEHFYRDIAETNFKNLRNLCGGQELQDYNLLFAD